jgi:hypothetical protein
MYWLYYNKSINFLTSCPSLTLFALVDLSQDKLIFYNKGKISVPLKFINSKLKDQLIDLV